ncbi:hypothetical protein [Pyrococcus kukulkanii]|uniref:hypothetical protein n=1 Tax=Pyrococcus kukulkanii TaxID=1609559 RepID=UPI00356993B5
MNLEELPVFLLLLIPMLLLVFVLVYFATFSILEEKKLNSLLNTYLSLPYFLLFWTTIMKETKSSLFGWLMIFGFILLTENFRPIHLVNGLTLGALMHLTFSSKIVLVNLALYLIVQLTAKWRENVMTYVLLFWSGMLLAFIGSRIQILGVLAFGTIHILGALKLVRAVNQQV